MAWGPLATQFCLELAFGVLLFLSLMPRAPLGQFFFRMMGTTALVPLLAAGLLPAAFGGASWTDLATMASLAAALAFPLFSGPVSTGRRQGGLIWALLGTAVALSEIIRANASGLEGPFQLILGTASALATGAVAGGVGVAMVVGHWYLTVPQLPVDLLKRLNQATLVSMLISLVLVGVLIVQHQGALASADTPLLSPFGLFHLGSRVAVGLALPLAFGWMTRGSLAYGNTRSATGILYASTVLVLIGAAASLSLQDSYHIPL
ncbi:MAG: hypothetical protein OSB42_13500 [Planctomycetota bacterium]|nr:hypothetical protein [Planctomycetota bacterium]